MIVIDQHRPCGVSKFGIGMAVLRPELPANRWLRVVRRHFTAADTRASWEPVGGSGDYAKSFTVYVGGSGDTRGGHHGLSRTVSTEADG